MQATLRQKSILGVFWSGVERFGFLGARFILQIILARLLTPQDFGIIGILLVFIAITQTLVDGGFASALIQDKNRTESDLSTAFIVNIVISIFCYISLFILAPFIADFYKTPEIIPTLRVIGVVLIINALGAIQNVLLRARIDFKTQFKASFVSVIISSLVGIFLAFKGYGVWALVLYTILNSILNTVLLISLVRWFPKRGFSFSSFKHMFSFGYKLMLSDLINSVYINATSLLIARFFSLKSLGFFSKAESFASFPSKASLSIITRVAFPVFSAVSDDSEKLNTVYLKYLRVTASIIVPMLFGVAAVAEPLICILIGEKWLPSVPMLQLLCIAWSFDNVTQINLNLLYAKRRSDLVLKLEIIKKPLALLILFIAVNFGVMAVCYGKLLYAIVSLLINMIYTGRFLNGSYFKQIREILPIYIVAIVMGLCAYWITATLPSYTYQLIGSVLTGILIYTTLAMLCKFDIWIEFSRFVSAKFRKSIY